MSWYSPRPTRPRRDVSSADPELNRIKRGAFLINVARGKLVDDEAVLAALATVGSAARRSMSSPASRSIPRARTGICPNVIVTPHTSGALNDYWTPLVALFSDNLRRFERDEPLMNVVDKVAGY